MARIKKFIDKKVISSNFDYYHDVYNLGISGNTAKNLLDRFESEARRRIGEDPVEIIFAIGVNDSRSLESETLPEQFRANLIALIGKARQIGQRITFVGLTPVDEGRLSQEDKVYKLKNVAKYNEILKEVCREQQVDFIDLYNELVNKNYKDLLIDGLHPNTEGHKQISKLVLKFLQNKGYL